MIALDVHHHFVPPPWLDAQSAAIAATLNSATAMTAWTPEASLGAMDRNGIAAALLSISTPGVWLTDSAAASRRLARACNEYGAALVRAHPDRFGALAALPLPDVDGSLEEIAYALDVLQLDGIGLLTSYDDVWPGDERFAAVFDELDRRGARVFFHPTVASCCAGVGEMPPSVMEFPFDTTRAIASLLFGGTLARCRRIKWIFAHGGGTIPMLAGRIAAGSYARNATVRERMNGDPHALLRDLCFDVVSVTNRPAMAALREFSSPSRLLFGSDYPFVDPAVTIAGLAACGVDAVARDAIERDTARALFPRFAQGVTP